MKPIAEKTKRERKPDAARTAKPCCGTLSYMAECRGAVRKTRSLKWQVQPDGVNRLVRNFPAV